MQRSPAPLLASLAIVAAGQAFAADNAVTDLYLIADLAGNAYEEANVEEGSSRKSASWVATVARGEATSSANASGTATIRATSAHELGDGEIDTTVSDAKLWVGDVLTIQVAGAKPGKRTSLKFTLTTSFTFNHAVGLGGVWGAVDYCLGGADCGTTVPEWVSARLALPAASGIEWPVGASCSNPPADAIGLSCKHKHVVTVIGPFATVPVTYHVAAFSSSFASYPFDVSAVVDGNFKWTLTLPDGVTCTSRSGAAFKGVCPKAAVAP